MGKLDSTQLEKLREIGFNLQYLREEQSRSLEEIGAKTYIPLRILRALEAGQDHILPEPVFIQGFIRRYADALGLDGKALSQTFPIQSSAVAVETRTVEPRPLNSLPLASSESLDDHPQPVDPDFVQQERPQDAVNPYANGFQVGREMPQLPILPIILGAVGAIALGGLVYGITRSNPAEQTATPSEPAAESAIEPAAEPPTTPPVAASPSPVAPPAAASNAPVNVSINLTDDSWVRITVDGETEFEGTLTQGTRRSLTAQESLTILAGNAGAVTVSYNNGNAAPLGGAGEVERVTFTADGANVAN